MVRSRSASVGLGLGVVAGLGSLLVSLAGCSSGDAVPRVAPSSPVSASVSKDPSPAGPVEPVMPAAAKKHTAAGAEAFVRFYWEMADYAQATGDVSGLQRLGSAKCEACEGGIDGIKALYEQGGELRGGETTLSDFSARRVASSPASYEVKVAIRNRRQVVDRPGAKHDDIYPASTSHARFLVDLLEGGWSIGYWEDLS